MQKTVWRYGVRCHGVKVRCRKADRHSEPGIKGLEETTDYPCPERAQLLALKWINDNIKSWTIAEATATKWTILDDGSERWEPFNQADNLSWPIQLDVAQKFA